MNTDSHYSSALDYSSLLNPFTQGSLDPILNQVTTILGSFSSSGLAFNQISRAFGISDENAIDSILFRLHQGDPSLLGNVSVLDDAAMNGAWGAYATPQDRIYLSQSLLTNGAGTHSDPLTGVAAVIIEEIGHRIDAVLNPGSDTIGDEGELFKNLVLGVALTEDELARIQGEDDTGSITVNGVEIAVEQDNALSTARAITVGSSTTTYRDWVGSADTNDYYRFTLGNTSNFNLSLTGLTADADVQLLNSSGTVIRSSNNSGSSSESITQQLAAGTYYARVLPYGSSSTYYNLNLSATPITTVTIAATDASAAETNTGQLTNPGQFTLTRTGLLTSALTANYTIGGTATNGSDYSGLTGSITFAAGSSTALINLNVINDSLVESSETVILTLANSSAYQIGSSSTATVTIADNDVASDWFSQNIVDVELQNLSRSRFTDGSLNRNDMIAILRDAKDGGAVTNTELTDLRRLVANWTALGMVDYVRVLSNKVVNSDAANTRSGFGNLFAGSSATQMENLIGKWFLGNDRPDTPYTYREASGSLFQNGVSYQDINQGNLGDCYLLAGLAGAAFRSPSTIQNMFIDNGDNTYTVRMYNNGVADYVTVDRFLPTFNNGGFAYASRDSGLMYNNSANELWVALAEKAYAQMNESGWISRWNNNYTNSYAAIDGGWSTDVLKQITNQNSIVDYNLTDSDRTNIINQFNAGRTVFMNWTNPEGGHALTLVGYNSTTQQFSIYNPWGFTYTLSWNQILNGGGGLPSNTIFDDWSYSA
ncbi:C2 family cysteine protease [Prochlorothrix hollandica]|uniref:C2 family cysteine protease n=1 Tax=Prochlorothrix hollandica TaxID=1223 RepID=UPI00333F7B70